MIESAAIPDWFAPVLFVVLVLLSPFVAKAIRFLRDWWEIVKAVVVLTNDTNSRVTRIEEALNRGQVVVSCRGCGCGCGDRWTMRDECECEGCTRGETCECCEHDECDDGEEIPDEDMWMYDEDYWKFK